eukprot:TRINITY_DN1353_c0_g2_i1.p1 TRINITY_DN1353_c0_g2~~TRINITY_DN1353_c0_g2_i1.p1  ORF type:complete len:485 (-),score=144.79 TRINITY_DN1353_c0_g2_i1:137-1591(-)
MFGVALGSVDFDFCKDLGVVCPIKAGTASKWMATYLVPSAAPGGVALTAEFTAKTSAAAQYSCLDVPVTMGTKPSPAPVFLLQGVPMVQPMDNVQCVHKEDVPSKKCYEACGEGTFKVVNMNATGACPDEYTKTDSTDKINACSDGVTNIKYCTGAGKRVVALSTATRGMAGLCMFSLQSNKCTEACADAVFKMTGLSTQGTCPSEFKVTEKTNFVDACSDGATNIKYCTKPLYPVKVTIRIKGEVGPNKAYWTSVAGVSSLTCLHREDVVDHKCYEACSSSKRFKVKGVTSRGACTSKYSETDSTKTVTACSDGVTNLKYCTAGGLQKVSLVMKTKGEAGKPSHKAYWAKVAGVQTQTSLYKITSGECGQATLDAKYASYAEKFAGLTAGTCASQGYTVADGTQSLNVPVLGAITIAKFKKPSVFSFISGCKVDSDCPSSYCNQGTCHGCADSCCETDADCTKKGMTYCQNDSTKMPPYFCHA